MSGRSGLPDAVGRGPETKGRGRARSVHGHHRVAHPGLADQRVRPHPGGDRRARHHRARRRLPDRQPRPEHPVRAVRGRVPAGRHGPCPRGGRRAGRFRTPVGQRGARLVAGHAGGPHGPRPGRGAARHAPPHRGRDRSGLAGPEERPGSPVPRHLPRAAALLRHGAGGHRAAPGSAALRGSGRGPARQQRGGHRRLPAVRRRPRRQAPIADALDPRGGGAGGRHHAGGDRFHRGAGDRRGAPRGEVATPPSPGPRGRPPGPPGCVGRRLPRVDPAAYPRRAGARQRGRRHRGPVHVRAGRATRSSRSPAPRRRCWPTCRST